MDGIHLLNEKRQQNYQKAVQKVMDDNTLSTAGKESAVSNIKQSIEIECPTADKWFLGYNTLEGILKLTDDPDYRAMPVHAAQNAIRQCIQSWESYFKLIAKWKKDHCSLLGRPKIPKYKRGMESNVILSNQSCIIKADSDKSYMKFPGTKLKLCLGNAVPEGCTLMQVEVVPKHGVYEVILVLEDGIEIPEPIGKPEKVASIDLGIDNFAAITDNAGSRPVLIKGKVLKTKNQWYNKEVARLHAQIVVDKNNRPTSCMKNHVLQARINRIWDKRDRVVSDFMHKVAKAVVQMLKDKDIDTLVVGRNKGWKQNSDMGKRITRILQASRFISSPRCWSICARGRASGVWSRKNLIPQKPVSLTVMTSLCMGKNLQLLAFPERGL